MIEIHSYLVISNCYSEISDPTAHAQQAGKIFRIGFLDPSTASGRSVLMDAFLRELHKLGWIEGKNLTIEYRFTEQKMSA